MYEHDGENFMRTWDAHYFYQILQISREAYYRHCWLDLS